MNRSIIFSLVFFSLIQNLIADDWDPRKIDSNLLRQTHTATRVKSELTIHTGVGPVQFKGRNDPDMPDKITDEYSLVEMISVSPGRTDYLVYDQYYEGHAFFLVNGQNGKKVQFEDKPILSPGHDHY